MIVESLHGQLASKNIYLLDTSNVKYQKYKVKIQTDQNCLTVDILKNMRLVKFRPDATKKTKKIVQIHIQISLKPETDVMVYLKTQNSTGKGFRDGIRNGIRNYVW